MILIAVATIIGAYLIGSINFAVIFANIFLKKDVRKYGSGNAGTTNVMRVAGVLPGILTFVFDVLKGFVACYAGKQAFTYIFNSVGYEWSMPVYGAYICGLACILGHVFPVFFQFKGGKGVATAVGIFYVCCKPAVFLALAVFVLIVLISKIVSLSSIIATSVAVIMSMLFYSKDAMFWPQALFSLLIGLVIVVKHSENIKRLINGKESKLNVRRQKNNG